MERPQMHQVTCMLTDYYDSIDAKDYASNFYITPDPNLDVYTLISLKRSVDSPQMSTRSVSSQKSTKSTSESPRSNAAHRQSGKALIAIAAANAAHARQKEQVLVAQQTLCAQYHKPERKRSEHGRESQRLLGLLTE